jgi:hypothetical protein
MDRLVQIEFLDGTIIEVTPDDEIPSFDAQTLAQIKRIKATLRNPDPLNVGDWADHYASKFHTTVNGTLRCGSCGATKSLTLADNKQYSQVGLPTHCGLPMICEWELGPAGSDSTPS